MILRIGALGRALAGSLLASLVVACAGPPPPNLYMLSVGSVGGETAAATSSPAVIAIGLVTLPDYLDQPQIATRQSAYELALAPNDRWAAPLYDMVPRVLVEDIALRLPSDRVVAFPQIGDASFEYRVAVDVNRFDVDASGQATLAARWQVYARSMPRALLVAEGTLQRRLEGVGYGAYAAALSGVLADFGDKIAQDARAVRATATQPLVTR